ncbi:MAG: hypothetical protein PUB46_07575 [Lachnospiraceae bacterium]|nr:hypothetical protein [Lachnospiraceae bacterium]
MPKTAGAARRNRKNLPRKQGFIYIDNYHPLCLPQRGFFCAEGMNQIEMITFRSGAARDTSSRAIEKEKKEVHDSWQK